MGSPMVFHTAPPQPASKARITCSPQLVGGPEASQKGLGERMPAKSVVRSATAGLQNRDRGPLAVGHGVHNFTASVDAVAAGVIFGIAGAARGTVDADGTVLDVYAARRHQPREARLAE